MPKKPSAPFSLKPKHLIYATLAICALAIVMLIVGVLGTFNPQDTEHQADRQENASEAARVEVWKPGSGSQGAIVLNPDALNQPRQAARGSRDEDEEDSAEEQARRNPFLPSPRREESEAKRVRPRPEREQAAPATVRPAPAAEPATAPAARAAAPQTVPEPEVKAEPKPRAPEPKAESKPAPQPKAHREEVIDNLF